MTCSNAARTELLGVAPALTRPGGPGAVSEPVACAMADGTLHHSRADIAVSVAGIAGPGGSTPEKPVGLVYFGWATRNSESYADRRIFAGDRAAARLAATRHALHLLAREIELTSAVGRSTDRSDDLPVTV